MSAYDYESLFEEQEFGEDMMEGEIDTEEEYDFDTHYIYCPDCEEELYIDATDEYYECPCGYTDRNPDFEEMI